MKAVYFKNVLTNFEAIIISERAGIMLLSLKFRGCGWLGRISVGLSGNNIIWERVLLLDKIYSVCRMIAAWPSARTVSVYGLLVQNKVIFESSACDVMHD